MASVEHTWEQTPTKYIQVEKVLFSLIVGHTRDESSQYSYKTSFNAVALEKILKDKPCTFKKEQQQHTLRFFF